MPRCGKGYESHADCLEWGGEGGEKGGGKFLMLPNVFSFSFSFSLPFLPFLLIYAVGKEACRELLFYFVITCRMGFLFLFSFYFFLQSKLHTYIYRPSTFSSFSSFLFYFLSLRRL